MANVNITLSADAKLVKKAREIARRRGTSLNELIRERLKELVGETSHEVLARELLELLREHPGRSRGWKFNREELYEERLGRSRLP